MAKDRKIDVVILGLLAHEDLTGYDIKKQIDGAISFFWKGSFGSIYPALSDMEKQGLVKRKKADVSSGREKIFYQITKKGKDTLKTWLNDEKATNDLKYETLLKMYFGGSEDRSVTLRNIEIFEEQVKGNLELLKIYKENLEKIYRYLQAGTITMQQMKRMIILFVLLSVLFGTALIGVAFWATPYTVHCTPYTNTLIFLLLGALAIIGAIKYTLGKHSYGYMGLGDLGVFLFFGLLSTMGAYYLQTQTLTWEVFWAGVAVGLPCVGVLNLNNIRDMNNDRAHHKRTFACALGPKGARIYHSLLLLSAMTIMVLYGHYWTLCVLPVWCWNLSYLWTQPESKLDKQMPVLMFSTLVFSVLACL